MLEDEAVGQDHGEVEDAPDGRQPRAVGHELLCLGLHSHVQRGHLYRPRPRSAASGSSSAAHPSSGPCSGRQQPSRQYCTVMYGLCSSRTGCKDWAGLRQFQAALRGQHLRSAHCPWHPTTLAQGPTNAWMLSSMQSAQVSVNGVGGKDEGLPASPLRGQHNLGGATPGQPDCQGQAEAAQAACDDVGAVLPAR